MTIALHVALNNPRLLGGALGATDTWRSWLAILKAASGQLLDGDERMIFDSVAGGRAPPIEPMRELWIVAGRRSGKSRMAAAAAANVATADHSALLAPGEKGVVAVISHTIEQAHLIAGYARAFLEESPVYADKVENVTSSEITLKSGITISCHAASFRSIRGRTILAAIFDEIAYWRSDESRVPDIEIYRAVKPALEASDGLLIAVGSPYRRVGLQAQKYREHYGKSSPDVLVVKAPSLLLNPRIDERIIARARADDATAASSEWDAEFRSDLTSLLDEAVIEAMVDPERVLELVLRREFHYRCFVDASAGRHDAFTVCIGHTERRGDDGDTLFVADVIRARAAPFNPNEVAFEYADLAKRFGCAEVVGDNYAGNWVSQAFADADMGYRKCELNKSQLYLEGLPFCNQGRIVIPAHDLLVKELRWLERRVSRSGKDSVDHPPSCTDDVANALFGAIWLGGMAGQPKGDSSPGAKEGAARSCSSVTSNS
jgi:Terminase large subunit, T4likevirus-type, N-terminal